MRPTRSVLRRPLATGLVALALAAGVPATAGAATPGPPVVHLQRDRTVAPAENVHLAVLRLSEARPVAVEWGDGSVTEARSHCSDVQATAHPGRCAARLAHAYRTQGTFRIVVKRSPRSDYRAVVTVAAADEAWQRQMLTAVNALRAEDGAGPLRLCAPLTAAAEDYARLMASTDYYGHVGPDGSQPWDRMTAKGYAWRAAAENIAGGYDTAVAVLKGWHDSPHHLANLLDPQYRDVGFGRATSPGSKYGTYWVQDFGTGGSCATASPGA